MERRSRTPGAICFILTKGKICIDSCYSGYCVGVYRAIGFRRVRHEKWLNLAIELARKNPNERHKHGAVLVRSGSVLAVGLNTERAGCYPSRHAEWHAVREHTEAKADLYVARIMRSGEVAYSEPCDICSKMLFTFTNVRQVFFTNFQDEPMGTLDLARYRREQKAGKLK